MARSGYSKFLKFLDENLVEEIFTTTDGFDNEAAPQILACESIITLSYALKEAYDYCNREYLNNMLRANAKAVRRYIELYKNKPETIQRLFKGYDYDKCNYPRVTNELCKKVADETQKLSKTFKLDNI